MANSIAGLASSSTDYRRMFTTYRRLGENCGSGSHLESSVQTFPFSARFRSMKDLVSQNSVIDFSFMIDVQTAGTPIRLRHAIHQSLPNLTS